MNRMEPKEGYLAFPVYPFLILFILSRLFILWYRSVLAVVDSRKIIIWLRVKVHNASSSGTGCSG